MKRRKTRVFKKVKIMALGVISNGFIINKVELPKETNVYEDSTEWRVKNIIGKAYNFKKIGKKIFCDAKIKLRDKELKMYLVPSLTRKTFNRYGKGFVGSCELINCFITLEPIPTENLKSLKEYEVKK